MGKTRIWPLVGAVAVCALCGVSARAALSLTYRWVTDQPTYTAPVNSTVKVAVFLEETVMAPDVSAIVSQGGLFSAGLRIVPNGPQPSDPADVLSRGDIEFNPEFSGGARAADPPDRLLVTDGILADPGPMGSATAPGVRRVLIGTFTFTVGAIADQTTNLAVVDWDLGGTSQDTITTFPTLPPQQAALDNNIEPAMFSITTIVPEPSLLTLVVPSMLLLRRRR